MALNFKNYDNHTNFGFVQKYDYHSNLLREYVANTGFKFIREWCKYITRLKVAAPPSDGSSTEQCTGVQSL